MSDLPYWGVVLNTPQEGPHDSAAITEALPQTDALDRQQLKSRPSPQTPSKTYGKIKRGEGGVMQTLYTSLSVVRRDTKRICECLARNGLREPAQTPPSVEVIQWDMWSPPCVKNMHMGARWPHWGGWASKYPPQQSSLSRQELLLR